MRMWCRAVRLHVRTRSLSSLVNFERASPHLDRSLVHVWPEVITEEEEQRLFDELAALLRRRRYSKSHWDSVIVKFRETERAWASWEEENQATLRRMQKIVTETLGEDNMNAFMGGAHVVDIAAEGYISPHVDSTKASGNFIAGLSLLSDCEMTLRHRAGMSEGDGWNVELDDDSVVDVKLPRRSLYLLRGELRFEYTHALSVEARRISIIFRDQANGDDVA